MAFFAPIAIGVASVIGSERARSQQKSAEKKARRREKKLAKKQNQMLPAVQSRLAQATESITSGTVEPTQAGIFGINPQTLTTIMIVGLIIGVLVQNARR